MGGLDLPLGVGGVHKSHGWPTSHLGAGISLVWSGHWSGPGAPWAGADPYFDGGSSSVCPLFLLLLSRRAAGSSPPASSLWWGSGVREGCCSRVFDSLGSS